MIEVLKQALDALEAQGLNAEGSGQLAVKAKYGLRQAIAELESQEPVGEVDAIGLNDTDFHVSFKSPMPLGTKLYTHPPQRTEPPDWFPAVENILNEYGLQAIDFVADFKAAMKDAHGIKE